jgi:hypothetical protein
MKTFRSFFGSSGLLAALCGVALGAGQESFNIPQIGHIGFDGQRSSKQPTRVSQTWDEYKADSITLFAISPTAQDRVCDF